MDRWVGKVALVTGASSGIGAATALLLARHGMKVVGIARRIDRLQELQKQFKGSGSIDVRKADVSKDEDIEEVFDYIKKKYGTLHVLVNNAGIYRPGRILDQDPQLMRVVLDVNVMALTICTQKAVRLMNESQVDDGHIFFINSSCGQKLVLLGGQATTSMYSGSKFAAAITHDTIRHELRNRGSKIKTTSIYPGTVSGEFGETSMKSVGAYEESLDEFLKKMPALRPEDVADVLLSALVTPPSVNIHEITIKPMGEEF